MTRVQIAVLFACFCRAASCRQPQKANLHWGKLAAEVNGTFQQTYKDNIALSSVDPKSDYQSNFKGMAGLSLPVSKLTTDAKYFYNLTLNDFNPVYNVYSHSFFIGEKAGIGKSVIVFLNSVCTRSSSYQPISDPSPIDLLSITTRGGCAIKTKRKILLSTSISFSNEHDYNTDDYRILSMSGSLYYTITPKLLLLAKYAQKKEMDRSGIDGETNDNNSYLARTGLRFLKVFSRLEGDIEAGARYARSTRYGAPETGFDDSELNLRLSRHPVYFDMESQLQAQFAKIQSVLSAFGGIRSTFGTNRIYAFAEEAPDPTKNLVFESNPFVSLLGVSTASTWQARVRLSITLSGLLEMRTFPIGRRYDRLLKPGFALKYNVATYHVMTFSYAYTRNTSNLDTFDYSLHEAGWAISAMF